LEQATATIGDLHCEFQVPSKKRQVVDATRLDLELATWNLELVSALVRREDQIGLEGEDGGDGGPFGGRQVNAVAEPFQEEEPDLEDDDPAEGDGRELGAFRLAA
jgi:hypothetical protein